MNRRQLAVTMLLVAVFGPLAMAQGPGPGGGRRGGGFGGPGGGFMITPLRLLQVEAVQKELELVDAQLEEIRKLSESMRGQGQGGGPGGANFQNMTDEERAKWRQERQQRAAEQAAKAKQELAGILLDEQQKRLQEIYLQQANTQALTNDADVATAMGLTEDQKTKINAARDEGNAARRELFQGGGGDDPEAMREKMTELNKKTDAAVLAILTAEQQAKFTEMKGKPFEMPPGALFGGPGGPGGPGGRNRGPGGPGGPGPGPNN